MARFSKGILKAKRHLAPNGVVDVTPERLKHWDEQQRLMLSRNLAPSVHFDHRDKPEENEPVKLDTAGKIQNGAHNAVGRLAEFALAPGGKQAKITLDLPDDAAADKSRKNIVGVSPVIKSLFRDGDGNEYRDCIVAYDLVTHPVDNTQTPFVEVTDTIACSLRVFDDANAATTYKLSAEDSPEAPADTDTSAETPPENPDMPADDSDKQEAEAIVAHLSQLGVELPADWSFASEAAGQIMLAALKTATKAKQEAKAEEETESEEPPAGETTVADPGYAAMSLYAENMHRNSIQGQLTKLLEDGRCTPAEAKQYGESLSTVKLSVDPTGKQLSKSDAETFIAHREALPKGTFWDDKTRTTKMAASVVEPGERMQFEPSEADAEKIVDQMFGKKPAAA